MAGWLAGGQTRQIQWLAHAWTEGWTDTWTAGKIHGKAEGQTKICRQTDVGKVG